MTVRPCVILLTGMQAIAGGGIRDEAAMQNLPEGAAAYGLAQSAAANGWDVVTSDEVSASDLSRLKNAVIVRDMGVPVDDPFPLWVKRAAAYCLESPLLLHELYHDPARYLRDYRTAYFFRGAAPRFAGSPATFEPLYWPNWSLEPAEPLPWSKRDRICMISGNKRLNILQGAVSLRHPRSSAQNILRWARARSRRRRDPWLRKELYIKRLELVYRFAQHGDFKLFGTGWDLPVRGTRGRYDEAVKATYQGPVPYSAKIRTMARYRFTLCLENTVYPGYVTEKIFDCLRAGSIPIYLGAPDVSEHVPEEAFINYRTFTGAEELDAFLQGMTPAEANRMISAGSRFLTSDAAGRFTKEHFGERLLRSATTELLGSARASPARNVL
ncbi:MAG: glycosyltransferase family 10 [Actinomycetota bacterium]|nr:glycosyltransferase family 10 [Actinomycetota bacterium]